MLLHVKRLNSISGNKHSVVLHTWLLQQLLFWVYPHAYLSHQRATNLLTTCLTAFMAMVCLSVTLTPNPGAHRVA